MMTNEFKVSVDNGIETREQVTPENWVDVVTYHPHSTPWDSYGNKEINEMCKVLRLADIDCCGLVTQQRRVNPIGSGPGGRLRFGDNMMPGIYRVAVHKDDEVKALQAIDLHKEAIHDWLHCGGEKPEACY